MKSVMTVPCSAAPGFNVAESSVTWLHLGKPVPTYIPGGCESTGYERMSLTRYSQRELLGLIGGVTLFVILVAYGFATVTGHSFIQLVLAGGALGTIGILLLTFINTSTESANATDSTAVTDSTTSTATDDASATSGLSPTERRVQNALITNAYRDFSEGPFLQLLPRDQAPYRDAIMESVDAADEETVQRVWRFSKDDGFFKRRPGSKSLTLAPKAVWRAEALGEEALVDDAVQNEILDVLLAAYRENPSYARIKRDPLIDAVGFPADDVDHNVWWLAEKGHLEVTQYVGPDDDAGYDTAEITDLGRQIAQ